MQTNLSFVWVVGCLVNTTILYDVLERADCVPTIAAFVPV